MAKKSTSTLLREKVIEETVTVMRKGKPVQKTNKTTARLYEDVDGAYRVTLGSDEEYYKSYTQLLAVQRFNAI